MITTLYAVPIAVLFMALSARVITYRRANRVSLGHNDDNSLLKRMRAQANCAEYAPFALILMVLLEMQTAPSWIVHLAGLLLLAGRFAHGFGFSASPPIMALRVWGSILTFSSYLVSLIALSSLAILGAF